MKLYDFKYGSQYMDKTMLKFLYKPNNKGHNFFYSKAFIICMFIKSWWTVEHKNDATMTLDLNGKVK